MMTTGPVDAPRSAYAIIRPSVIVVDASSPEPKYCTGRHANAAARLMLDP
jgi:hypothetical protein